MISQFIRFYQFIKLKDQNIKMYAIKTFESENGPILQGNLKKNLGNEFNQK